MKCCVLGCKNYSDRRSDAMNGITFHAFPTEDNLKQQWITKVNRHDWTPSKYTKICSAHFNDEDFFATKKGLTKIKKGTSPSLKMDIISPSPTAGPSEPKRVCRRLQTAASSHSAHKGGDAVTVNTANDVGIYTYHDPEAQAPDQQHDGKGLPLHVDLSCKACHNDIIGFRYTCVQCADWDMCASCEARGEHPTHYVLRLPAPKPSAESAQVLAAIRREIHELLRLHNEIHEISIKEEPVEVKEEIDIDITERNTLQDVDMHERSVPELNTHEGRCTAYMNPTEHEARYSQSEDAETGIYTNASRDSKASRDKEATGHSEASRETDARRNTSPAGDPEQDELDEAVRILRAIKTELNDDPLSESK